MVALNRIADDLTARDVAVILAYHPTVPELQGRVRDERQVFETWAHDRGVAFLEMHANNDTAFYRDHIHPTADGAGFIAQTFLNVVEPLLPECG